MFMPFTIHLDPYLRKVIKEERANFLAMQAGIAPAHPPDVPPGGGMLKGAGFNPRDPPPPPGPMANPYQPWATVTLPTPDQMGKGFFPPSLYPKYPSVVPTISHHDYGGILPNPAAAYLPSMSTQLAFKSTLPSRLADRALSTLTAEEVGDLLRHLDGIRASQVGITTG